MTNVFHLQIKKAVFGVAGYQNNHMYYLNTNKAFENVFFPKTHYKASNFH